MAEEQRIRLDIDDSGQKRAIDESNRRFDDNEKRATSSQRAIQGEMEKTGGVIARVTDSSQRGFNRMLAAFEKKAQFAGLSDVQRVVRERDKLLSKAGGAGDIDRIVYSAQKQIDALRLKEFNVDLAAAQRGTRAQNAAADQFAAALTRVNRQHREEQAAIESKIRSLEKEAALKGKTGVARVEVQRAQFIQGGQYNPQQLARINASFDELAKSAGGAESPLSKLGLSFGRLTSSIVVAQVAVDVIKRLGSALVDFGKESIQYAARTEQLFYAQNAIARGSNISTAAVEVQARAVQKLGITIQDARMGVTRMIAANMDYTRSAQLARAAQDLGRVAGITSAEAFERLVHATVTAQPELLRALGLNVSFEQSYARYARQIGVTADALTEQQKRQVALNAVLDTATKYQGAYEESAKTAGGQLLSMQRYITDVKQALGEQFLPVLTKATAALVSFVKGLPKAVEEGRDLVDGVLAPIRAMSAAANVIRVKIEGVIDPKVAEALENASFSAAKDRYMKWSTGVRKRGESALRGLPYAIEGTYDRGGPGYRDFMSAPGAKNPALDAEKSKAAQIAGWDTYLGGKAATNFIERQRNTEFGIEQRLAKAMKDRADAYGELASAAANFAQTGKGDALDAAIKAERRFAAESQTVKALEAQKKAIAEMAKLREKGREFVTEYQRAFASSGGLQGTAFEVKPVKIDSVDKLDARTKLMMAESTRARDFENDTLAMENSTTEARLRAESIYIQRRRDLELTGLKGIEAITVEQKIAVEQRRLAIVTDAMNKEAVLKAQALEREKSMDLEYLDWLQLIYPERTQEIALRRSAIVAKYGQKGAELEAQWIADGDKLRADSEATQRQIQFDAWKNHFDSLKRGFEGLFDAALMGGRNFADTLKRLLINTFLTPVKEQMANMFAKMFAGAPGGGSARGGFSPAGAMASLGMGGFSAPATTPPFWGGPGGGSGAGGFGGWGGMFASQKNWLTSLGNIGYKPARYSMDQMGNLTKLAGAPGVGGWQGGALLAGGGVLAADGLRRGGWLGMAETTAGGAMIGAKFGGPVGAAIGAAVGAGAGLIRMLFKGGEQKTIEKVRSRFGVTIDKAFAKTLLANAKQFGGLDLYLGTAQARELIWLYAESTNQRGKVGLADDQARGVNLTQSGGRTYQTGTYVGGVGYGYSSSLASMGSLRSFQPQTVVSTGPVYLDADETKTFWSNIISDGVVQNPRGIQAAANNATSQSAGRVLAAINLNDPLAVTI